MRWIALLAAAAFLSACGGHYCPTDMSGLEAPPWGSAIPTPHG